MEKSKPHDVTEPKDDGQRRWDRDDPRVTNQWPSHQYNEGQTGNENRAHYRGQIPHPSAGLEKRIEQDMEIGYEDKPSPLTLETLEKKFHDEIIKLAKEESDAEDAENVRHKENKIEISNQYLEKLTALRVLQAKQREEFLNKETQERLNQYQQRQEQEQEQERQQEQQRQQQAVPSNYPTERTSMDPRGYGPHHYPTDTGPLDPRGYGPNHYPMDSGPIDPRGHGPNYYPTDRSTADLRRYGGPAIVEPQYHGYAPSSYEPYRERSPYRQVRRNQPEAERKVPIPQGRAYNNTRARNL